MRRLDSARAMINPRFDRETHHRVDDLEQILTQLEGIAVTIAYCGVVSFVLLKIIDAVMGLRVDDETEVGGLDINLHGEVVH